MKRRETSHHHTDHKSGWKSFNGPLSVLTILTVGLGSMVSGGCVAIPAVMLTSAAVTAAAVVSEGERLVQYQDTESSVIVRNETDGDCFSGETCQRHGALPEGDQPGVKERQEARDGCPADRHEPETLHHSDRPRT